MADDRSVRLTSTEYSRKYAMNTSVIANNLNNLNNLAENTKNMTIQTSIEAFSLDVGRCDFDRVWVMRMRSIVYLLFLIITSTGAQLLSRNGNDNVILTILDVLYSISSFKPREASLYTDLMINIPLLLIILSIVGFSAYMVSLYYHQDSPTNFQIYSWIFIVRVVLLCFNLFSSELFASSLYGIIYGGTTMSIIDLIFGAVFLICQIGLVIFSSTIYNATPVFRQHDDTQIWYAYSHFDWQINYLIYISAVMQQILRLFDPLAAAIIYVIVCGFSFGFCAVYIYKKIPFIRPLTNSVYMGTSLGCLLFCFFPLIVLKFPNIIAYFLLIFVALLIVFIVGSIFLITFKLNKIVARFSIAHPNQNDEETDEKELTFELLNLKTVNADYDILGIQTPSEFAELMRVGFLFNVDDVITLVYVDWAVKNCAKPEVILCAVQIALSTESNQQYFQTYQQMLQVTSNLPLNSRSFIIILNNLRQESLTQVNKPLLTAIAKAKKANTVLMNTIHDFWGAVLKQKPTVMNNLIPLISEEMYRCERIYQRLLRGYPYSQRAVKEMTIFLHQSIGDHKKMVYYQSLFDRIRKKDIVDGDGNSVSAGGEMNDIISADLDKSFLQRMEPWIAAQEAVENLPSTGSRMITISTIFMIIVLFLIPSLVFGLGINEMISYRNSVGPIETIGDSLYYIARIPQLARRKNLFVRNQLKIYNSADWPSSTGPPLSTLLEFLTEAAILPNLAKYTDKVKLSGNSFLEMCNSDAAISAQCEAKTFNKTSGNSSSPATPFDLMNSFANSAENLVKLSNWNLAENNANLISMFENFDSLYSAVNGLLKYIDSKILSKTSWFDMIEIIFYVVTWGVSLLIILPLILFSLFLLQREIKETLTIFPAIPKSTISSLRWSSKSKTASKIDQGKGGAAKSYIESDMSNNSTMSEREVNVSEHMVESLATIPRRLHRLYTRFLIVTILYILMSCTLTTAGAAVYKDSITKSMNLVNAYIRSIHVTSSCLASYVWTQELFSDDPIIQITRTELKSKSQSYVNNLFHNFNSMLYGNSETFKPGILLGSDIVTHFIRSKTSVTISNASYSPMYGLLHSVYFSMSCDAQMRLLEDVVRFVLNVTDDSQINHFNFSDEFVYHYEHILFAHLDAYFQKGTDLFNLKLGDIGDTQVKTIALVFVILYSVQILFLVICYWSFYNELKHHFWTVRHLILLIPPESLLKTQLVIKFLSGMHNANRKSNSEVNSSVKKLPLDFIVNSSHCALLIANERLEVTQTNTVANTFFKTESLIGKNLRECLTGIIMDKEKHKLISKFDNVIDKMRTGRHKTNQHIFNSSMLGPTNQLVYIGITLVGHSSETTDSDSDATPAASFSVVISDRTSEHYQEALVESEKKKSENLITSLLPPSIVQRINDGETDISFEVQQATVLFASVVGWTDLIANWDAVRVMQFLNSLFSAFDSELHNFPAITKLKTIGHIYMIAGGLFNDSSVNSAAVVTSYAVNMLGIVKRLNEEHGIDFKITAGINTGGPINCGILGHTRPVFDILGDVVNVSSRMNSFSLPGYIQISEPTYNHIKFMDFNIKERGDVMIKGKGKMKTYLVSMPNIVV